MGVSISTGRLVAFGLTELNTPNDLSHPCETSVSHLPPFGLNSEKCEGADHTNDAILPQLVCDAVRADTGAGRCLARAAFLNGF